MIAGVLIGGIAALALLAQGVEWLQDGVWLPLTTKNLLGKTLRFSGVIGVVEIVDCVSAHPSKWFEGEFGFVRRLGRSRCR